MASRSHQVTGSSEASSLQQPVRPRLHEGIAVTGSSEAAFACSGAVLHLQPRLRLHGREPDAGVIQMHP
jgi:hypothetical protein